MYTVFFLHVLVPSAGQKRAPDLITGGCQLPYGCWDLNSGALEEQPVLLTSEIISPALKINLMTS